MPEMVLSKIKIDEKNEGQVIVLKEKEGKRVLPIIIGIPEVAAIKRNLSGIQPPRPMTHDLLVGIIDKLGAKVEKIVVDDLKFNTFHAKVVLKASNGKVKIVEVDARPSDSIAVALRASAPIFVEEQVFEKLSGFEDNTII